MRTTIRNPRSNVLITACGIFQKNKKIKTNDHRSLFHWTFRHYGTETILLY